MPNIKLPDGNTLTFEKKVTGLKIAEKISKSLAKQALIMEVDGELKDLFFEVKIFTVESFSIKKLKSLSCPFTSIISACFDNELLIFSAIWDPLTAFEKLS